MAVIEAVRLVAITPAIAMKVADVAPGATVTEAGTVSNPLLLFKETVLPPAGATLVMVTVQVVITAEASPEGLQASEEIADWATRFRVAIWETPLLIVAITEAVRLPEITPAVALKVADVAPAATVTKVGMVSNALLLDKNTGLPPAGAAAVSVTVQVLIAPEARPVGLQASEDNATVATRFTLAVWKTPFMEAVTEAVRLLASTPAVALKVADVAPAATVTEAGVVSEALLLDKDTETTPPAIALRILVKVTIQVLIAPEARLEGLQVSDERITGATRFSVALIEAPFSVVVTEAV